MIITSTPPPKAAGMSISTSNVLDGVVPVVTDGGIGEDASNITNADHSLTYSSGSSVSDFSISFGLQVDITYVAISGHNAATTDQASIELWNGAALVDSVVLKRNNNVMFTFNLMTFQDMIIKFVTVPNTYKTTVSYIAAGMHIFIPGGEQAGYKRAWLKRHLKQRTQLGDMSSPISTVKARKPIKLSLSLPNNLVNFSRLTWQDFLDFAESNPFFINEDGSLPEASYICFDYADDILAHNSTRALDVIRIKFAAYNGL